MSVCAECPEGPQVLVLPPILDLPAAAPLKRQLEAALGDVNGVVVDASAVQKVTTACLQVLASAVKTSAEIGGVLLQFQNPSAAFMEATVMLSLTSALNLSGNRT